ncbi:uncharacterized protein LOC135398110 [Ornithodoros turicata]|uniref:uncharacterized protein LOC135398110 n=1 Tax=Ornithodoros turicata TaxID=34597 RepID=UPI0031393E75
MMSEQQEPLGLFAGWQDLATSALTWATSSDAPTPPSLSPQGGLLLSLLSGQPRALALLLVGLVYTALLPVAAVALLAYRRRFNSRSQDITQLYNVAWYAYCFGLAFVVASGMVTALALIFSRADFNAAYRSAPEEWQRNFAQLQRFVNNTGRELSNSAKQRVAGRLRDATDLLDSNFTHYFEQTLADAIANDLNATANCSIGVRAIGRNLQHQGLNDLGRALVAAADWCTRLEQKRDSLLHAAAEKVEKLTKQQRQRSLARIRGETAPSDTYLSDVETALKGLDRAKQRVLAVLPSPQNGLLDLLAYAGLNYVNLLTLFDLVILALLAAATLVGVATRRDTEPPTERGAISHGAGRVLTGSATFMIIFCFLATPMILGILILDVGLQCHVCIPYREQDWKTIDKLTVALWPLAERGNTFKELTPSLLFSRCAADDDSLLFTAPPLVQLPVLSQSLDAMNVDDSKAEEKVHPPPEELRSLLQSSLTHSWLPLSLRLQAKNLLSHLSDAETAAREAPRAIQGILRSMTGKYYGNYLANVTRRLLGGPRVAHQLKASPGFGSCKPLYNGFMSALASLCGPLQRGLTGYWFALSLDILRYTAGVIVCLGASKYLLRMKSYSYEGQVVEDVRDDTPPVPRQMWAKRLRKQPQRSKSQKVSKIIDQSAGDLCRLWPPPGRGLAAKTQLPVFSSGRFMSPPGSDLKRRHNDGWDSPPLRAPKTLRHSPTRECASPWGEPYKPPKLPQKRRIRWRAQNSYKTISSAPLRGPYGFSDMSDFSNPSDSNSSLRWH